MKTKIIPLFLFLIIAFTSQAQEKQKEVCDCPKPTEYQFTTIYNSIYAKKDAIEGSQFGYRYIENLYMETSPFFTFFKTQNGVF